MPSIAEEARIPVVLRVRMSTGFMDLGITCPHCGRFHPVDLPDAEDVSEPVICPTHPLAAPLVGVRDRYPEPPRYR